MSFEIVNPAGLPPPSGYNHGMLGPAGGRILFVAGQAALDDRGAVVGADLVGQWGQALDNVLAVVAAAGGRPEHIGRMTVYVVDRSDYLGFLEALGRVHRERMGRHYPAMALLEVKALADSRALVEIEATAVIP